LVRRGAVGPRRHRPWLMSRCGVTSVNRESPRKGVNSTEPCAQRASDLAGGCTTAPSPRLVASQRRCLPPRAPRRSRARDLRRYVESIIPMQRIMHHGDVIVGDASARHIQPSAEQCWREPWQPSTPRSALLLVSQNGSGGRPMWHVHRVDAGRRLMLIGTFGSGGTTECPVRRRRRPGRPRRPEPWRSGSGLAEEIRPAITSGTP
jgi:hypothetical protein